MTIIKYCFNLLIVLLGDYMNGQGIRQLGFCNRCKKETIVTIYPFGGKVFCEDCFDFCSVCGKKKIIKKIHGKKICNACINLGTCKKCGRERSIAHHGLCHSCYVMRKKEIIK